MKHLSNSIHRQTNNFNQGKAGLNVSIYAPEHAKFLSSFHDQLVSHPSKPKNFMFSPAKLVSETQKKHQSFDKSLKLLKQQQQQESRQPAITVNDFSNESVFHPKSPFANNQMSPKQHSPREEEEVLTSVANSIDFKVNLHSDVVVSEMDSNLGWNRYRDSQRYVNMENNYQYLKCRSVSDYKGGAGGDRIDKDKDQSKVRNYKNLEGHWQETMKSGYRKIHQDAQISRFLQRFPELKQRKEVMGANAAIISGNSFSEADEKNPFRQEMSVGPRFIEKIDQKNLNMSLGNEMSREEGETPLTKAQTKSKDRETASPNLSMANYRASHFNSSHVPQNNSVISTMNESSLMMGSQVSPRLQELKKLKQIRYQRLNQNQDLNNSTANPLLQPSIGLDGQGGPKSALYQQTTTHLTKGQRSKTTRKQPAKFLSSNNFIQVLEVNQNSPTCQSKLRMREKLSSIGKVPVSQRPFFSSVKQTQNLKNIGKLYNSATQNLPKNATQRLFPIPDKHLVNISHDQVHTTRRAQVLNQNVLEDIENTEDLSTTKQERVFLRTSPKPIETCTTFPDSLINSENSFELFLQSDVQKALVFRNFKKLNRDLTKAYLRQLENQNIFGKKGSALPDNQIKRKEQDEDTFQKVTSLFNKMLKRSRYGYNAGGDLTPFSQKQSSYDPLKGSFKFSTSEKPRMTGTSPTMSTRFEKK